MTVVFNNEIIGAREIMSAFGLLNGDEVTFDAEYTLPILMEALSESDPELDTFDLLSNQSPSFKLSCLSRSDYNDRNKTRFKYVSASPACVTAAAFWNAFLGDDDNTRLQATNFTSRLRVFNMMGLDIGRGGASVLDQWSFSLESIVGFAPSLEELGIMPIVNRPLRRNYQRLNLAKILPDSARFSCLRFVTLENIESPEPLLVALFAGCSRTLVNVKLQYVSIFNRGSWSEVLRKLRNADFEVLDDFVLFHCGEAKDVVRAQPYLKRITDKDPIAESVEKQNDDSD